MASAGTIAFLRSMEDHLFRARPRQAPKHESYLGRVFQDTCLFFLQSTDSVDPIDSIHAIHAIHAFERPIAVSDDFWNNGHIRDYSIRRPAKINFPHRSLLAWIRCQEVHEHNEDIRPDAGEDMPPAVELKDKRPRHAHCTSSPSKSATSKLINRPQEKAPGEADSSKHCHSLEVLSRLIVLDALGQQLPRLGPYVVDAHTESDGMKMRIVDREVDGVDDNKHRKEHHGPSVGAFQIYGVETEDPEEDECSREDHGHVISKLRPFPQCDVKAGGENTNT